LVLVMEHDHGCSMETHYEMCESRLCKGIGEEISRDRKDKKKKYIYIYIYMRLAEGKRQTFWRKNEVKFIDFHDN